MKINNIIYPYNVRIILKKISIQRAKYFPYSDIWRMQIECVPSTKYPSAYIY